MHTWLIIIGIIVFVWLFLQSRKSPVSGRNIFNMGKSTAKEVTDVVVTFKDVAGVDEAKEELEEIIDFLRNPDKYARLGAHIPKGVLLVGPPGTGKTLLSRAVAGESGVPFFQTSGSEFMEMIYGVGPARVRDLFKNARKNPPCIIFIDELDALGRARGTIGHDEQEQTLTQMLVEMDGFDSTIGVIVMAATNRPEILDQALLRPGRFDRQILVDRPDKAGREAILKIHSQNVTLDPSVDLAAIAGSTQGFAGADLANLINEAALLAARGSKEAVGQEEIQESIERVMVGLEKKGRILSPEEKRIVAVHELGHAVVAEVLPKVDPVRKVSVVPRGMGALGITWQQRSEDRFLRTASELRQDIAVLLGGRASEVLFLGEPSTGAQDDLARATDIASDMVRRYGMSELGLRTFERPRAALVNADMTAATPRDHGDQAAGSIDQEVDRLILEGLERATEILKEHEAAVLKMTDMLIERQKLSGAEVRAELGLPPMKEQSPETVAQAGEEVS